MTIDPYCTVKCEKTQSVGLALKDNHNPVWDQSFVFYFKNPATAKVSVSSNVTITTLARNEVEHVQSATLLAHFAGAGALTGVLPAVGHCSRQKRAP